VGEDYLPAVQCPDGSALLGRASLSPPFPEHADAAIMTDKATEPAVGDSDEALPTSHVRDRIGVTTERSELVYFTPERFRDYFGRSPTLTRALLTQYALRASLADLENRPCYHCKSEFSDEQIQKIFFATFASDSFALRENSIVAINDNLENLLSYCPALIRDAEKAIRQMKESLREIKRRQSAARRASTRTSANDVSKNVLCLGMVYADVSASSVADVAELVVNKTLAPRYGRDMARCLAMEALQKAKVYTLSSEPWERGWGKRHVTADLKCSSDKVMKEIQSVLGGDAMKVSQVFLDYFYMPKGYVMERFGDKLFGEHLVAFACKLLLPGGKLFFRFTSTF